MNDECTEPLVRHVELLAAERGKSDAVSKGGRWLLAHGWIVPLALLMSPLSAAAQVSVHFGLPGINVGINQPVYPRLVPVPGIPVYYDPGASSNYFFYDGMYWVYAGDSWYASSWYNGPWALVAPQVVPVFLLRVPVRYYRQPPAYFRGWGPDAPPRWGQHWGNEWERQRGGWDRWDRASAPRPAPLPVYQKNYSGNRYPHPEQQQALHGQNYRYQPRDAEVKQIERNGDRARSSAQAKPSRGDQQDEGHKGNSAQAKGQERGQDHDR